MKDSLLRLLLTLNSLISLKGILTRGEISQTSSFESFRKHLTSTLNREYLLFSANVIIKLNCALTIYFVILNYFYQQNRLHVFGKRLSNFSIIRLNNN